MEQNKTCSHVKDADFIFSNKPTKAVAIRNSPKIELAGLTAGPFEEGNEYEVKFWVAQELEKAGIVRLGDETLTASRLYQTLHRERIQPASNLSSLPEGFYPRLRRLIEDLKNSSRSGPEKMREYEYAQKLSNDIVGCRLKKIISLACTPGQKSQILRNLTAEELELHGKLEKIINEWRKEIL